MNALVVLALLGSAVGSPLLGLALPGVPDVSGATGLLNDVPGVGAITGALPGVGAITGALPGVGAITGAVPGASVVTGKLSNGGGISGVPSVDSIGALPTGLPVNVQPEALIEVLLNIIKGLLGSASLPVPSGMPLDLSGVSGAASGIEAGGLPLESVLPIVQNLLGGILGAGVPKMPVAVPTDVASIIGGM